jgi:hypothetical protein
MKPRHILLLSFLVFGSQAKSQNEEVLTTFTAVQLENRIQLNFTIATGNTCNGIQIYRAANINDFTEIGDIQGVCGSADHSESFTFTDDNPEKSQDNYYRLQLGNLGYSYPIKIHFVDLSEGGFFLYPNPLRDESRIFFSNFDRESLVLKIFSSEGKFLFESDPNRGNEFSINRETLVPGIYFFSIANGNALKFRGKFMVY